MTSKKIFKKENDKETLIQSLKRIVTLELASISSNLFERVLWLLIAVIGTIWGYYFMKSLIDTWIESPLIISKGNVDLTDLKYPAITFCSKGNALWISRNKNLFVLVTFYEKSTMQA